jgi:hypothetical protein
MFVDHLHDDSAALKACSLASRILLPASQTHLFLHVGLHTAERLINFLDILNGSSPFSRIVSFVRSIGIGFSSSYAEEAAGIEGWKQIAEVCLRMGQTGRVSQLLVRRVDFCTIPEEVEEVFLTGFVHVFDSVTDLTLTGCFGNADDIAAFVSAFSYCKTLNIESTYTNKTPHRPFATARPAPVITNLGLHFASPHHPPDPLINAIFYVINSQHLRHFSGSFTFSPLGLENAISRLGKSLEYLSVGYEDYGHHAKVVNSG